MEIKKSSNANNENLRFPIALMAFLFVGGLLLASFTYETMIKEDLAAVGTQRTTNVVYQMDEDVPEPKVEAVEVEVTPPPQAKIVVIPPKPEPPKPKIKLPPPPPKGPVAPPPPPPPPPIDFPDVEASFPGGPAALQLWIAENVVYPETSIALEDQGKVYLSFIVEADGSITGVEVTRKISKDLDREAKRVTKRMPNWTPGEVAGKRVRTRCSLPIVFTLE